MKEEVKWKNKQRERATRNSEREETEVEERVVGSG